MDEYCEECGHEQVPHHTGCWFCGTVDAVLEVKLANITEEPEDVKNWKTLNGISILDNPMEEFDSDEFG